MPVGTPIPANELKVEAATALAPTAFSPVSLLNRFEISGEENVAEFDIFDSDDPITFAGKRRRTLTLSGYLAQGDTGQGFLFAAAAAKEVVMLRFYWDGTTNGFTQECRVRAYSGSASAGNQPVEVSFDFTPTTAAGTLIGTGPLL